MQIDVILPVLNEAGALPWVLERMPALFRPIVVDNGSTDDSSEIARRHGALVVSETRRGFGSACYAGLLAATSEIVCFMDCDGSLDPVQLTRVSSPIAEGAADLALGRRRALPGAWPLHARLANSLLARRVKRRTGLALRDLGPMRCARRDALIGLAIQDRRFGWPLEMVLGAHSAGWMIVESDVDYLPRSGRSKVTGTVRGTLRTIADMEKVLAR